MRTGAAAAVFRSRPWPASVAVNREGTPVSGGDQRPGGEDGAEDGADRHQDTFAGPLPYARAPGPSAWLRALPLPSPAM